MSDTTKRLDLLMKLQAIVFLLYGLVFLFIPRQFLGDIFQFDEEPTLLFVRSVGATFLALALMEYFTIRRLSERLDLVWGFAAVPFLIFLVLIWDKVGQGDASDSFFWVSIVITAIFAAGVGFLRWQIKSS